MKSIYVWALFVPPVIVDWMAYIYDNKYIKKINNEALSDWIKIENENNEVTDHYPCSANPDTCMRVESDCVE